MSDANWSNHARRKARLEELFDSYDEEGEGKIDFDGFQSALSTCEIDIKKEKLSKILESYDTGEDEMMEFEKFCELFDRAELENIFNDIDDENTGLLDSDEIGQMFQQFGLELGRAQIDNIMDLLELDSDGCVSKKNFFRAFDELPELDLDTLGIEIIPFSGIDVGSQLAPPLPLIPEISLVDFMIATSIAGITSKTLTAPLERVKILAQTGHTSCSSLSITRNIIKEEGIIGLFRGNLVGIFKVVPTAVLVSVTYFSMVSCLPKDKKYDKYEPYWRFMLGGVAGAFGNYCTYPMEVIRARMAVQNQYTMTQVTKMLYKEGTHSFFRGIGPTLLGAVPFVAIQYSSFYTIKISMLNYYLPSVPLSLGCGIAAGMIAQSITYPLDVIRRQMQISDTVTIPTKQAIKEIFVTEGYRGLFRGLIPATIKVVPAVAISMLVRDACLFQLNKNER